MIKIKLCGLTRPCEIEWVNALKPDYIGFVFWKKSRRYVTPEKAMELKSLLDPGIQAVGVFIDEPVREVERLLKEGIIDAAQLHGRETEDEIAFLKEKTGKTILKAFKLQTQTEIDAAHRSSADHILLDAGNGCGKVFDWSLLEKIHRPYFLAGGLTTENISSAVQQLRPFGVDVSSGIETDGVKDFEKMKDFVLKVRKEDLK